MSSRTDPPYWQGIGFNKYQCCRTMKYREEQEEEEE